MKILLIHQYFKIPEEGSGIRTWHIAHRLVSEGHQVDVISGHNQKSGQHTIGGINVNYFKIPYSNEYGFIRRLWSFFLFVLRSRQFLRKNHEHDLCYILTTPLTTGLIGLFAKRKFTLPYFFEVGDLWPMAPIQMGVIKNERIKARLYRLEENIYKNASGLVALSPGIKEVMDYVVDYQQRVNVVPNMSDCGFFTPSQNIPEAFSQTDPFVIGYQGAIGRANHLEYLLDLAALAEEKDLPIKFRVMGDGSEKHRLKSLSKDLGNLEWVHVGGKAQVMEEIEKCHATYLSYAPYKVLETGSPNKLFDGLAAGKLIISNFGGWIKELIEEEECGFAYTPTEPESFLQLVTPFLKSTELLESYQQNSRSLAANKFEVDLLTGELLKIITSQR